MQLSLVCQGQQQIYSIAGRCFFLVVVSALRFHGLKAAPLLQALKLVRVKRLPLVSGAASLETAAGKLRIGAGQLLADRKGTSHISMGVYTTAMVDELKHPRHIRQRFTVGY